jgi:hypothetical protein
MSTAAGLVASPISQSESSNIRPPSTMADRESEIKEAIRTMISARNRWSKGNDNFFPDWLEDAISASLNVALNGDVPAACINLHTACVRLADAWGAIVMEGEGIDSSGIPGKPFWALMEAVEAQLKKSESVTVRRLRPVAELLEEYKGDNRRHLYIARDYGWFDRSGDEPIWRGPFFKDGAVDTFAIEQEARNPGSVVPVGWHPEDEHDKQKKQIVAESGSALTRIRNHLKSQGKLIGESTQTQDPASVEELLKQGQFVAVIARVKGITEDEVRKIAKQIGVRAMSKEEYFDMAQMENENPEDKIYRESMIGPDSKRAQAYDDSMNDSESGMVNDSPEVSSIQESAPGSSSSAEVKEEVSEISDSEANDDTVENLDSLLSKLFQSSPDIDTPKAMQALKTAGIVATGQAVGRKLSALRSRMTESMTGATSEF